ncbi:hypothetical protein GUITHDRAFT_99761 [Guillardia theta CCMP2712]|uniref:Uncharacterized protein n=1 Tax=Guillardia theta (strain CCMP2712) TaxID=905079 RepID=L1K1R3_GUITC|nr:hypothetical protein GUITHDRAFT_99761 [Guillardia theta CCMP2712]EKX54283.1 hypothetical protein GUITHDRAFT_99761 [Guillardia theta CCMP2712]|eukprot:XP_005841263.1 hypothetical protein GUITHDRAFT_99761 [Guillardia theta CCMP2712]
MQAANVHPSNSFRPISTTAHEQCTVVLCDICAGIVTKLHHEGAVKDLILKASQTFYEFPKSYGAMKDMVITYNTYCKPKARNFPCMDALSLSKSGVLYMFQMTGAGKHPIKLEPLYQILKALRVKNTIESVCFVFVLPEHLERKRSRRRAQSFKFEGSIPKELAEYNLTQYSMVLSKRVAIKV